MSDVVQSSEGKKEKTKGHWTYRNNLFFTCACTHLPALNPVCEALPQEKIELRSLTLHDTRQAPSIFIETWAVDTEIAFDSRPIVVSVFVFVPGRRCKPDLTVLQVIFQSCFFCKYIPVLIHHNSDQNSGVMLSWNVWNKNTKLTNKMIETMPDWFFWGKEVMTLSGFCLLMKNVHNQMHEQSE